MGLVRNPQAILSLVPFAINPWHKFAEKLSAAAVPGARPNAIEARKLDIDRAALEGALEDGELSDRERAMPTRLKLELGIPKVATRALEAQVMGATHGA